MINLKGKNILITGGSRRIGRHLALSVAKEGGNVILHYGHSFEEANKTKAEIDQMGVRTHLIQYDLNNLSGIDLLVEKSEIFGPLYALVNNAAIFKPINWNTCTVEEWNNHISINLSAPFFLSQAFAKRYSNDETGRIINLLDWRALRPGVTYLPYTITKAALAALTKSLALSFAPKISVNGLALGAILPPADKSDVQNITKNIPMGRWATIEELTETFLLLLTGPAYITGEIIHVDGGRHLV